MTPKILAVIPARIHSTRLPRKPLQLLLGEPLISHTYRAVAGHPQIHKLLVATDSEEVAQVVRNLGGEVILTPPELPTGTHRAAYVAQKESPDFDIVLNIQGDEPLLTHSMLSALMGPLLQKPQSPMGTLACPLDWEREYENPANVKVLVNARGEAIYFSRAPIPYLRQGNPPIPGVYKHMGLYGFRRDFLLSYPSLPPSHLDAAESLEQLRVLDQGIPILVGVSPERTVEVNLPEELIQAEDALRIRRGDQ
jgi:3-deoxy-manno-octulosonate cytidylyltransferase (CMP-KDO synthetase)